MKPKKIKNKKKSNETDCLFFSKKNKKRLLKGIQKVKEGKTTKINIDNLWKK